MALARSSGSRRRGRAVARTAVGAASAASFRNAPGAKAGCAFFAPGFFAQAKKGGSRRHGAKALDLDSCCRTGEEQEQLAALAPSSALRTPSPASGRRAVWTMSAGGRTASRAAASPTGILTQPLNAPEESPPDGSLVHGGRPVPAGHHPDGQAHVHARQGRRTGPAADQGTAGCRHADRRRGEAARPEERRVGKEGVSNGGTR